MGIGTVDKKVRKSGLKGGGPPTDRLNHVADFKKVYDLHVEPGGWFPADDKKR